MKEQRIKNVEKDNTQLMQSRFTDNPLKARTKESRDEEKNAFYKGVQALRREMRIKSK